ncbi:MAG: hypothetical protein JNK04_15330, partial [Myxococcales bacterium]|nr:hypothetical protein [Myxococcales bacterium]
SFDADTLSCDTLYTLTATDNGATQQVLGVAADASGVYLAGSFTRQIIAAPLMSLPVVSGEDGFVVALKPDLSPGAAWIARATSSLGGASDQLRSIAIDGTRLVVGGHLGTGTGSNTPSFGRATGGEVCTLEAPVTVTIDGFVGVLQKSNGDCLGATRLGEGGVDHVRAVIPDGQGVIATGFTDGMAGLETTVAAPLSRNGFIARLDASLGLVGGIALGGTSLDYVDGARPVQGGVVVAGSFGAPFDLLTTQDDFYVGKLELE